MPELDPTARSLRARIAAHTRWRDDPDPRAATQPARDAFHRRFLDEVDPDRTLPEEERERRAAHARKLYFVRLSYKSAQARRRSS